MATKKKTKAAAKKAKADVGPPDPREHLEPKPANLTATLKQLKTILADIPAPDPIIEEPEPEPEADAAAASESEGDAADGKAADPKPAKQEKPVERLPQLDFIDALLHLSFSHGLPCGYGQEVRRRIEASYVDRNEFRVTEAFEVG